MASLSRTTARARGGERGPRASAIDANPTSEDSIVDGAVRARNSSRVVALARSRGFRERGREPSKGLERRRGVTALTSWGMWDFSTWLSCWAMASCGWCGVGARGSGGFTGSAYCRCRALSKWSAEL